MLVVNVERLNDRGSGALAIEVFKPQHVVEQRGNAGLEAIEFAEAVFAHRHQKIHAEIAAIHRARELTFELIRIGRTRIVKKVLFELIEDKKDQASRGPLQVPEKFIQRQ